MAFYAASTVLGKRDEKSKTDNKQKKKKKKEKEPHVTCLHQVVILVFE